jgi:hypothetical protein
MSAWLTARARQPAGANGPHTARHQRARVEPAAARPVWSAHAAAPRVTTPRPPSRAGAPHRGARAAGQGRGGAQARQGVLLARGGGGGQAAAAHPTISARQQAQPWAAIVLARHLLPSPPGRSFHLRPAGCSGLLAHLRRWPWPYPCLLQAHEALVHDAEFRIGILERRLKRHEEAALAKYHELDRRIKRDPRLYMLGADK